jgi:LPXTG-motif cell wall-anchored protein
MYTVNTGIADGCTFDITFSKTFCDHLQTNDRIVIYYTGILNEDAIVGVDGNGNTAWLHFGENHKTEPSNATTYTYEADIVKTDSQNTLIDGAVFKLYDSVTGGNEVKLVKIDDKTYRRAKEGETGDNILVKDGIVTITGFDNGDYWLEEISAPSGYNQLTSRVKFTISDANLKATFNGSIYSTGSGIHVINQTGNMLPETGGLGTTIFVTLGGLTVLAAGVVLFAKKRMSQIEE